MASTLLNFFSCSIASVYLPFDHPQPEHDVVDRFTLLPALVAHRIIEQFFKKRDVISLFAGLQHLIRHGIDELVMGIFRDLGQRIVERGNNMAKKDRDVGIDFFSVFINVFEELPFELIGLCLEDRLRLLFLTHNLQFSLYNNKFLENPPNNLDGIF